MTDLEKPQEVQDYEEESLSHTDKITGVFTEPGATFTKIAAEPAKTGDWLIPILILLAAIIATTAIIMNDPVVKADIKEKAMAKTEQNLNEMVKTGQLSQMQADEQIEAAEKRLEMIGTPMGILFQSITIVIFGFIVFFIIAAIHLAFLKLLFKDPTTYKQVLVSNGLASYISLIAVIVATILSMVMGKAMQSVSLAAFLDLQDGSIMKVLAAKVDPISIWAYIVLGIAYSKFAKAESPGKYFALIFGLWIGWSILWHYLAQAVPFLRAFSG